MGKNKSAFFVIAATATLIAGFAVYSVASASTDRCRPNECVEIEVDGSLFELTGESFQAYNKLTNFAEPLNTIGLELEYLPSRVPYLINVDGPTGDVEEIIKNYDIEVNDFKMTSDGNWMSSYGFISKSDLEKLLKDNSVESLTNRSVSIAPIGTYSMREGAIVQREHFLSQSQESVVIEEHSKFHQEELSKILKDKSGVKKLD